MVAGIYKKESYKEELLQTPSNKRSVVRKCPGEG